MKKLLILFSGLLLMSACYYDNNSELHPAAGLNTVCDTVNLTYSGHINAIYSAYCVNGCHSLSVAESGIILETYEYAVLADDNELIAAIEHTGPFPMPQAGTKLSDCHINQIKLWIQNGKPE
jgi:hypothetical protein